MIWRGSIGGNSSTYEKRMFPPSVNGKGEINPTHNFVDGIPNAKRISCNSWLMVLILKILMPIEIQD